MEVSTRVLTDYLIHEGMVEGRSAFALLWTGCGWAYGEGVVTVEKREGGYQNVIISSDKGIVELASVDNRIAGKIQREGMYVIYQVENGDVQHLKLEASRNVPHGH